MSIVMPGLKGNNNVLMKAFDDIVKQIKQQTVPPVDQWRPDRVAEIDIEIDADGNWYHEQSKIQRQQLVNLFASILWFEQDRYYLVTPVEKLAIKVADVPYVIQQASLIDKARVAVTNTGEQVIIGSEYPIELREYQGQWLPYLNLRFDIWARVGRAVYYEWVTEAMEAGEPKSEFADLTLTSNDYRFCIARQDSS